jgi:hypothetical protein
VTPKSLASANALGALALAPEDSSMPLNRIRLPQPSPLPPAPDAFVLWSCPGLPAPTPQQEALYRWAFAQAQAVAQPSLPERDLAGTWN